ncbi:hypothetical protein [Methylovulum miyakonense]|uniref:hypothetical protein n=1 Tax=Methylovulum miyakonense TaxID=645578 RepID=UPI000363EF50|nr:hypothetical protein [Methylovulum miyakonense]
MKTPSPSCCHQLAFLDSLKEKIARVNVELLLLDRLDGTPELQAALDLIREIEEGRNALHRSLLSTPDPAPAPVNPDEQLMAFLQGHRTHIVRFAKRLVAGYNAGNSWVFAIIDDLTGVALGMSSLIQERQPNTAEAARRVVVEFLAEVSCHFDNPLLGDDEFRGAEHE